jgi:hypothetical protein
MQNLSPTNIGAFQKNETYVPNGISFFEMPCFFLPYDTHWWVPHEKEKKKKKRCLCSQ